MTLTGPTKSWGALLDQLRGTKPDATPLTDAEGGAEERVIRPSRFQPPPQSQPPQPGAAKKRRAPPRPAPMGKIKFAKISLLLLVALPTLLATIYFGLIASHQYSAQFQFAVRSNERSQTDQLGILSQFSNVPLSSESYIVAEYLKSRQFIEDLKNKGKLLEIYGSTDIDWFLRISKTAPIEDIIEYWKKRIDVHFDSQTGIVTAEVRAFKPQDAKFIGERALALSAALVNQLSRIAREEQLATAEGDVKRMEIRVATSLATIKRFRDRTGVIDPSKSAGAGLEILAKFQGELAQLKTQLAILTRAMEPTALPVVNLKQRIRAMEDQIRLTRAQVGSDGKSDLPELSSQLLGEYESLVLEKTFAEKAYLAAMQALEVARSEAARNQRYLSVFVRPHLPEYPSHPKRILMILAVFAFSFLGWGILSLTYLTVRDHIM